MNRRIALTVVGGLLVAGVVLAAVFLWMRDDEDAATAANPPDTTSRLDALVALGPGKPIATITTERVIASGTTRGVSWTLTETPQGEAVCYELRIGPGGGSTCRSTRPEPLLHDELPMNIHASAPAPGAPLNEMLVVYAPPGTKRIRLDWPGDSAATAGLPTVVTGATDDDGYRAIFVIEGRLLSPHVEDGAPGPKARIAD